ncbi:uncharacterized protein [Epargyreus clarus]|uniref:uncharacterized protein n=1 Tax=Epargyreus clarus TaxID=520877 RepID=UPI003C309BBB
MTSILDKLPYYTSAKNKVKSWFMPEELDFSKFSGGLMRAIITTTIAEVGIYKMLQQNIRHGDLPSYTTDALIIGTSIMEALLGPFFAWYGIRSQRTTLITWMSILTIISFTWYAVPDINFGENPENCFRSFIFTGYSLNSITRLLILSVSCIVFSLTRVVSFTHGAAHMDRHDPKYMSLNYGTFVIARVVPLILGDKIATTGVDDYSGSHIRGLVIGSVINLVQIVQSIPRNTSEKPLNKENVTNNKETDIKDKDEETIKDVEGKDGENSSGNDSEAKATNDVVIENKPEITESTDSENQTEIDTNVEQLVERDFCSSLKRVVSNKLVMYQAVAMGLMAAALWGFAYNNDEIVKIKFLIDPRSNYDSTAEIIRYVFLVILVLYASTFFYPLKLSKEFLKKASNIGIIMSGIACFIYVVLVDSGDCAKGIVAGMDHDSYQPVGCGEHQCNPSWKEFSPVCVPDSLLTFLSAREAGCTQQHEINGVMVYVQCACSGTSLYSIATVGACSDVNCTPSYQLHLLLFLCVAIATTISLQAQGLLVLRAVNPVDKSLAMGVASSIITICSFVGAHLAYNALREHTCLWLEDERCHLQNEVFPYWVGYCSAGLALLSVICSLLAWRARDRSDEQTDETKTDEKKTN